MNPKLNNGLLVAACFFGAVQSRATIYDPGSAPSAVSSGLTFGTHLIGGTHPSVPGVGGGGLAATGSVLDGSRTYIWDTGAAPLTDLADGIANRGDAGFAMMIWDMGAAYDSMRLYTHQDHYSGGPITDPFVAQDVMEYSVWGSHDGDHFVLLSDVTAFAIHGGGAGLPTYTFAGTAPSIVYRGGSAEYGTLNAYTREYVFGSSYRYFGVRSSTITVPVDGDPEIDAIAGFNISTRPPGSPGTSVPDGGSSALLLVMGSALLLARSKDRNRGCSGA